jgi:hypothetical protein
MATPKAMAPTVRPLLTPTATTSRDGADDSDSDFESDGADDSDSGRRVRRRTQRWCAPPRCITRWQPVGLDNSNDGPGAALSESAPHELSDGDADACSALYGSAVLTLCQRALQLLHDGGVRASTAAAAAPGARAHPFPLTDLIMLARAAACNAAAAARSVLAQA